ncbi:DUF4376 domain-containing protein [Cupriavidus basilensis]|uniref:DUF4376 domain-containing protein n=1 Tax=Cupriavidus basilensis TaxID=68895 RepID=UPI0039F6F60D
MEHAETVIYHCDPATGEFLGSGAAYIGPAGDVQVPAFATVTPSPECPEGHVAVMVGAPDPIDHTCQWAVVMDWRGEALYSTADGSAFEFGLGTLAWHGLGDLPEQLTSEPRPSAFHIWLEGAWTFDLVLARAAKVAEINAERARREVTTFPYAGKRFDADEQSEKRIVSATQLASLAKNAGRAFSMAWTAADNTEVELDADALVDLALALAAHRDGCHRTAKLLKDVAAVAGDEAALAAITWPDDTEA